MKRKQRSLYAFLATVALLAVFWVGGAAHWVLWTLGVLAVPSLVNALLPERRRG